MFNPAKASKKIRNDFVKYLSTSFKTCVPEYNEQFSKLLEEKITKGPFVDINDVFKTGKTLNDLITEGVVSGLFKDLESNKPAEYEKCIPLDRPLFKHQEEAIRKAVLGKNIVITTGTGSGKTESFLYPTINKLLREKEAGNLGNSGIKAILIYPMNALANDQINRIREILMSYPDITFGVFTGDTPKNKTAALNEYKESHSNEKYQELRDGLPNEILSREEMYERPPHILITNYVMLEYLLLRSDYSGIFNGSDIKTIVLDESHVYRGATGMETSMLLRKLRARVGKAKSGIQYILTSATLGCRGKSEPEIASFANKLSNEPFDENDIVFGERENAIILKPEEQFQVPLKMWEDLSQTDNDIVNKIFTNYGFAYDHKMSPEENLFELCGHSNLYCKLREVYLEPTEVSKIANALSISEDDAVSFLFVCSKASKNGLPLIDIHYHFFVRALEGAYVTLTSNKKLFLERKTKAANQDRVFEIARCNSCGDIAIIGQIIDNSSDHNKYLVMQKSPFDMPASSKEETQYFHIIRQDNEDVEEVLFDEISDELDEDSEGNTTKQKKDKIEYYWLCPYCGQITKADTAKPNCGHDKNEMIKLAKRNDHDKCLFCSEGNYSGFYVGSDGATSVLGMSLFESLPNKPVTISDRGVQKTFDGGKQFLCFSDSRSEAAYFASYEERTYNTFVARRGLAQYLETIKDELINQPSDYLNINELVNGLSNFFLQNNSFSKSMLNEDDRAELKRISTNYAWMIVLDQLVGYNRKNYLQPMGFLQYQYLGVDDEMIDEVKNNYLPDTPRECVKDFLLSLTMTFFRGGAFKHEDLYLDDFVRDYVFRSQVQNGMLRQKAEGNSVHYMSWIPQNKSGKTDEWRRSNRQDLVKRVLKCDGKTANDFLDHIWKDYLTNTSKPHHAVPIGHSGAFVFQRESIGVLVNGHKDAHWYKCDKCEKTFTHNVDGLCQVKNCNGHLKEITDMSKLYEDNYYYQVYKTNYLKKLLIEEHTAQLSKNQGANYQEKFRKNLINCLSCSTTFEMGVNLGHLETVFLRDMPPTAANYIQRAGRAGRSKEASAYAMTYAKLSSHDFDYFERPLDMIKGAINPPSLKENNQKIVYRHIFSVVLGYFFRKNPQFFDSNPKKDNVQSFFQKNIAMQKSGYDLLKEIINDEPDELTTLLKESFGDKLENEFNISGYGKGLTSVKGWAEELIGSDGRLESAEANYLGTINDFFAEYKKINDKVIAEFRVPTSQEAAITKAISKKMEFINGRNLIDFFVEMNILPKYGFPVDTVELKQNVSDSNSKLSLSRDMSQAISEYAPGCQVIANKKMFTPRYVAKVVRAGKLHFDEGYYCECGNSNCKTPNFVTDKNNAKCIGCDNSLAGVNMIEAIQPSNGMIAEKDPKEVPSKKPKKLYHSRASYVGKFDNNWKKTYSVNGKFLTTISTENDKIMVTTPPEHPFYVCQKCGYSLGRFDIIKKENSSGKLIKDVSETKKLRAGLASFVNVSHITSNGSACSENKLHKRLFVHTFNTDIVQILFNDKLFEFEENETPEGISVLYALLSATSKVLDVEENDIAGCLIPNTSKESTNIRFVIYDNVPGGAGHVKRMLTDDGATLEKIIEEAFNKMDCQCEGSCYNCLKNYQNQYYHSILSHEKARNFLGEYIGKISLGKKNDNKISITLTNDGLSVSKWAQALKMMNGFLSQKAKSALSKLDVGQLPDLTSVNSGISGYNARAVFSWPSKKVLIVRKGVPSDISFYNSLKDKANWKIYLPDDDFDEASFLNDLL